MTAWEDMTSDIRQVSDIARAENPNVPLIAFGHSMGSALTQSHVQNHGDLLAGAILCGTMGSFPGVDDAHYDAVIVDLRRQATGAKRTLPARSSGSCCRTSTPRSSTFASPTGSEWQSSDPDEVRLFQRTRSAESPSRTA